jgi:hypothetical protein
MKAYTEYKEWWKRWSNERYHVPFEDHINSMTLYELMELLETW